jgi:hypothetical protein
MAMLPNLRVGAPAAAPGTPAPEDGAAPDLFAQLLGLLPNVAPAATPEGDTVTSGPGLEAAAGEGEADREDTEASAMFLPTFEMQRTAPTLAAAMPAAKPVAGAGENGLPPAPAPAPAPAAPGAAPGGEVPVSGARPGMEVPVSGAAPGGETPVPDAGPAATGKMSGHVPVEVTVRPVKAPAAAPAVPAEMTEAPRKVPVPEPLRRAIQALKTAAAATAAPGAEEEAKLEKPVFKNAAPAPAATAPQPVQQAVPNPVQQLVPAMAEAPAQPALEPTVALPRETVAEAVERQLDVSADGEWLDQLARDIVRTGAGGGEGGALRFRLNPETLGQVRVELSQSAEGATVRIAAETEGARALLADAQPRLLAEARAQGVRIAETEVSLAGFGSSPEQQQRREEAQAEPRLRTALGGRGAPADTGEEPARTSSDRYA